MTEAFAAAGSLVALLAWVYYAAQIFLLGAEFTKAYADEHGSQKAAQAMKATAQTAQAGVPVETPPTRPDARPVTGTVVTVHAHRTPIERAADTGLTVATRKLIFEVVSLALVTLAGQVLARRRKAAQKTLHWQAKVRRRLQH